MSRLTGLVREMVMARLFGAGFVYDAFLLGFRIPNLTRDLFAEGALSSAFVPIFTQTLAQKGRKEAAVLSNLVATALILLVGSFCILGVVFSPTLVDLLAEGFRQVPGKFELAVKMTRIMFPFLLLVALAAQAMGVLNACNRFAVPALASTFFNIGSVVFGLALGYWLGPMLGIEPISGMAIGVVLGGALQLKPLADPCRASFRGLQFSPRLRLEPSRTQAHHPADGSGHPRQRRRADQRHGQHQLRLSHSGQRSGELARIRVPFHATPARTLRRCDRVGNPAFYIEKRGRR